MNNWILSIVIFLGSALLGNLYAQPGANPYTARLTVVKGGSVDFVYNSIQKVENGINLPNYTKIVVCFNNPDDPSTKWMLKGRAITGGTTFLGDYLNVNLNTVQMVITPGPLTVATCNNPFLSSTEFLMVNNGTAGNESQNELFISYFSGPLVGIKAGHYYVDVELTLYPQP